MKFPPRQGLGEQFTAVLILVYGRMLFSYLIAVHTFPTLIKWEVQYKWPLEYVVPGNFILFGLFMWMGNCFPNPGEPGRMGRKPIRSHVISRCAHCFKPGWSLGKGVVVDYCYWMHDRCDTEVQNQKAQDDLSEALKGIK